MLITTMTPTSEEIPVLRQNRAGQLRGKPDFRTWGSTPQLLRGRRLNMP